MMENKNREKQLDEIVEKLREEQRVIKAHLD
jgi:hypothetical protein